MPERPLQGTLKTRDDSFAFRTRGTKKQDIQAGCPALMERATRLELASGIPQTACGDLREPCRPPKLKSALHALAVEAASSFARNEKSRTPKPDVLFRWSGQRGSNSLPPPWQGGALPDELCPRSKNDSNKNRAGCQAPVGENQEKSENRADCREEMAALRSVCRVFKGRFDKKRQKNKRISACVRKTVRKSAPVQAHFYGDDPIAAVRFRTARPRASGKRCTRRPKARPAAGPAAGRFHNLSCGKCSPCRKRPSRRKGSVRRAAPRRLSRRPSAGRKTPPCPRHPPRRRIRWERTRTVRRAEAPRPAG